MVFKVKLNNVANAVLFSTKCGEYSEDIDYFYGKYVVDAKSLIGVIGSGLEHISTVDIHTDNELTIKQFKDNISMWIVEE